MPSKAPTHRTQTREVKRHMVNAPDTRTERGISYSSPVWKSLRRQVWVRDTGTCQLCGKVIAGLFHVDHKDEDPKNNDMSNLQLAHPACHSVKTAKARNHQRCTSATPKAGVG